MNTQFGQTAEQFIETDEKKHWIEINAQENQSIDEIAGIIGNVLEVYIETAMENVSIDDLKDSLFK